MRFQQPQVSVPLVVAILAFAVHCVGCSSPIVRSDRMGRSSHPSMAGSHASMRRGGNAIRLTSAESTGSERQSDPVTPAAGVGSKDGHHGATQNDLCDRCSSCEGPCGPCMTGESCPAVVLPAIPHPSCLKCLGPLVAPAADSIPDAELMLPPPRFIPVPTRPVFASRSEYEHSTSWNGAVPRVTGPDQLSIPLDARPIE